MVGYGDLGIGKAGRPSGFGLAWPIQLIEIAVGVASYVLIVRAAIRTLSVMIGTGPATRGVRRTIAHGYDASAGAAAAIVGLLDPVGIVITMTRGLARPRAARYAASMSNCSPLLLLLLLPLASVGMSAEPIRPGRWDVTSTIVDLSLPGVPGFIQRMIKGKSKAERKLVSSGQGIDALLAPDPKARCTVETQQTLSGRYAQALSCPQRGGQPIHVLRSGTYDAAGFSGEATISGSTAKGPMRMVLRQRAARIGD